MMPDTNYMNLGWWLHEAANGDLDPMVAAWAAGEGYDKCQDDWLALIGKATFQGIAVGKYTHKSVNDITGGHFNADAKLVADFDNATDDNPGNRDRYHRWLHAGWPTHRVRLESGVGRRADDPEDAHLSR